MNWIVELFIELYEGRQKARRIAVCEASKAERLREPFEDYLEYLLKNRGVDFDVLPHRERQAILHLFEFGGAA